MYSDDRFFDYAVDEVKSLLSSNRTSQDFIDEFSSVPDLADLVDKSRRLIEKNNSCIMFLCRTYPQLVDLLPEWFLNDNALAA